MKGWRKEMPAAFPNAEIIFLNDEVYLHTQKKRCDRIVQKGVEILNDGKPTIVLAHSYGGILSKTMIERAKSHNVVKLVTMASPHKMKAFGVESTKQFLKTPETVDIPTYTIGGFVDPIVPYRYTKTANSIHEDLWCEHMSFLLWPKIRRYVLNKFLKNVEEN